MSSIAKQSFLGRVTVVAGLSTALVPPAAAQVTQACSINSMGQGGNGSSEVSAVSADGRFVAFRSSSSNLVPGDTNSTVDVFLRDRPNGVTERVSVDSSGVQSNGSSASSLSISADGRFVVFDSLASNLVPGDTNATWDAFVRDRQSALTERVNVDSSGAQADLSGGFAHEAVISDDGRYVAFNSVATNLAAGDTNGVMDVFVRDRQLGITERISLDSSGAQANGASLAAKISADGRHVMFTSTATNLVPGDTNGAMDVFIRDRQFGTTERVSVNSFGGQANGGSFGADLSADGRFVAFTSSATDLVPGDVNARVDVFVRDLVSGATERVSLDSLGVQGNSNSTQAAISDDGRYVAFSSDSTNLIAGDTNFATDVFLRDRLSGATERVSVDSAGAEGGLLSLFVSSGISADGRHVVFYSQWDFDPATEANGQWDVFIRDRETGGVPFCFGDGSAIACPCMNNGGVGRGCSNSLFATGAQLSGAGMVSVATDTLVLDAGAMTGSVAVFFQGATSTGATVIDDGLGCVGGPIVRLGTKSIASGTSSFPQSGDPRISVRGAIPPTGGTYYYQTFYRNAVAAFCPPATSNRTNGVKVTWVP